MPEQRKAMGEPPIRSTATPIVVSVVSGIICLLWGWALILRLTVPRPGANDFLQDWLSARNFSIGKPIYWPLEEATRFYFGRSLPLPIEVNAHPPASVLLVLPFAQFEYPQASLLWNSVSLLLLVVTVWLIIRPRGLKLSKWSILPIAALLLTSNALAQQVNEGQFNLILLCLIVGAWSADRNDHPQVTGILIGVAAAIKLFPAFLALYLVCRRQWLGLVAMTLTFTTVNIIADIALGPETYSTYYYDVLPNIKPFQSYWMNSSIVGFWSKLFNPVSGHTEPLLDSPWMARIGAAVSSSIVTVLAGLVCCRAKKGIQQDLAFSVCVIAMLLVSPVTWDHYFLLLILPFAAVWKESQGDSYMRAAVLLFVVALCTVNPKVIWDATITGDGEIVVSSAHVPSIALPWETFTIIGYPFWMLVGFFLCASARVLLDERAWPWQGGWDPRP